MGTHQSWLFHVVLQFVKWLTGTDENNVSLVKKFLLGIAGCLLTVFLFAGFTSTREMVSGPVQHSVYIWQRQWTPALVNSLTQMRGDLTEVRVLAVEFSVDQPVAMTQVDFGVLAAAKLPVYAVVRLDGRRSDLLNQSTQRSVIQILQQWQRQLPDVKGIEIDFDCPRSQLKNYRLFLHELREKIPAHLLLSNTSLPDWLNSSELPSLLAQTDESVLQLHAVSNPAQGLFDPNDALLWAIAYKKITHKRFQLALPAYGSNVAFNADGKILAIESEQRSLINFDHSLELEADAQTLARFLGELKKNQLRNVIWFRLPTADDQRAWSVHTLRDVIEEHPLVADVEVTQVMEGDSEKMAGLVHLEIANKGNIAAAMPRRLRVSSPACTAADGLGIYQALPAESGWLFSTDQTLKISPQQRQQIGWLRCPPGITKDELKIVIANE